MRCVSRRCGRGRPSRWWTVLSVMAVAGCGERQETLVAADQIRTEAPPAGVDPARVHMPLEKIPPPVTTPTRTETKPLSERAQQQVTAAQRLIEQQRYTEASIELERALRYDPNHPSIHRVLALLHWQAGNADRARTSVQRALEGNNDDAAAHYLLARCLEATGDKALAIQEFRTAMACSDFGQDYSAAVLTLYRLAETLAAEGYLDAALSQFAAATVRLKTPPAGDVVDSELAGLQRSRRIQTAQAGILEQLGRYGEAADLLGDASVGAPTDTASLLQYARLLVKANRPQDALRVARGISEDSDQVVTLLTEIHTAAGNPAGILDDLRTRRAARPNDAKLVVRLAGALRKLGQDAEAKKELESFLQQQPDAWNVRAQLLDDTIAAGDWAGAIKTASEAARVQPARWRELTERLGVLSGNADAVASLVESAVPADESAAGLYLRGLIVYRAGKLDAAERLLQKCLNLEAGYIPARETLARLNLRRYRYDDALRIARRKDENAPEDASLELVLGEIYERLDDTDNAVLHLKAATQLNSADTAAMLTLAHLYRNTDDTLSAQRLLRLILDKDASNDAAREALVLLYLNEGKLDAATEQLEELRRKGKSPHVVTRAEAMAELIRNRDPEAYRKSLIQSLESNGPDTVTWMAVAESYSEFEQEHARQAFLNVLALDPDHEDAALGVTFADQRLLRFEEAAERFVAILPRRPNRHAWRFGWPGGVWRMGAIELLLTIQDYDGAYRLAQEMADSTELDPAQRTRYRLAMLEARQAAGRSDEALALLTSWSPTEPGTTNEWSVRLAREYLRQENAAKAIPILESMYGSKPAERARLGDLVEALAAAKEFDRASQYALGWFMDDPANDDALSILTIILIQQDRPGDALELSRNRLQLTRDRERFQDLQMAALDKAGRHEEAAEYIDSLLAEAIGLMRTLGEPGGRVSAAQAPPERLVRLPNEPFAMQQLHMRVDDLRMRVADQLMNAKRHRESESRLREWLEDAKNPQSRFRYLLALANSQRDRGDDAESAKTLELALALRVDHIGINNDVAYGWIDRGIRLDDAERMISFSLSREPRQMAYLDTFGWLMYKKGRFAEARKWLERAAQARKDRDPVVLDHLGDACWRLGDKAAAVTQWMAAVKRTTEEAKKNPTADEKRVADSAPKKIEAAQAGREPEVAPVAEPTKAPE